MNEKIRASNFNIRWLFFICIASSSWLSTAQETITRFASDIILHSDGTTEITEHITIAKPANTHGFVRELPTRYGKHTLFFKLKQIAKNNSSEPYHIEWLSNGLRIFIGSAQVLLPRGAYTYDITYSYKNHINYAQYRTKDESDPMEGKDILFLNITGSGMRLPIKRAVASITFPENITPDMIQVRAYTGAQGAEGTAYTTAWKDKKLIISTTEPLPPFHGLTIALAWPAGYISMPSIIQKIYYIVYDNLSLVIACFLFICVILMVIGISIKTIRTQQSLTIIPLFYLPENLSPAEVGCIYNKGVISPVFFAAQIVYLAVKGLLTIEYQKKKGFSTYILHKQSEATENNPELIAQRDTLFNTAATLELYRNSPSHHRIRTFQQKIITLCAHQQAQTITYHNGIYALCISTWILGLFFSVFGSWNSAFYLFPLISGIMSFASCLLFRPLFVQYTPQGETVYAHIEGFKMYLTAAEVDRMKIIGTPPTKTPQLYEQYLPYAIALGVEAAWTAQFTPYFTTHPEYHPAWVHGSFASDIVYTSFAPNFTSCVTSSLHEYGSSTVRSSSWSTSSTGFGNRGSSGSGGGVGGGGGGSW